MAPVDATKSSLPRTSRAAPAPVAGFLPHFTACPWCGGASPRTLFEIEGFQVDACRICEVGFLNPPPDDALLGRYYYADSDKWLTGAESRRVRQHLGWKEYDLARIWPKIEDLRGGRHLDLGCGIGGMLLASQRRGFNGVGIEFSPTAAEFGTHHFGLKILPGKLADHPLAPRSFALVTLYHVLEHLREPGRDLEKLAGLVRPGGALVIECPNWKSWSARFFGPAWFHLDPPRHLFHFTPKAVEERLIALGFRIADRGSYHPAHGRASFYGSLFRPQIGLPLLMKVRRRALVTLMKWMSPALAGAEARLATGSVFRIIARKVS